MKTAVAGTFDVIHDGHRALFDRAFGLGSEVCVGLTSDKMASEARSDFLPYHLRKKALEDELAHYGKPFTIFELNDLYGDPEIMDAVDVLVVSKETESNGYKVNAERESRGVRPLIISVVPLVMASDGNKVSAHLILEGKYGRDGSADVIDIVVGSANHVKIEAVRSVMERIYGKVKVTGVDVPSGVPDQPKEEQTREGAVNRAKAALGDHDLSVGIEAGVFECPDGLYDFQYCAVLDRNGRITVGSGPGFMYPPKVAEQVRKGSTVGDAMKTVFGQKDIGKGQGAIGYLSKGLLDRKALTEQSVTAAMVPRLNDSYADDQ